MWNINGLASKIADADLRLFLKQYDISCLCETWLKEHSDPESIRIPGYDHIVYNRSRRSMYGRPSGGIVIYYKKRLGKALHVRSGGSELVDFTIADTHFVFAYVAPDNSTFQLNNNDTWRKLESLASTNNSSRFYIMGDLNGRTGTLDEGIDDPTIPARRSCDDKVNTRGQEIISLCRANDLLIANSRAGDPHETSGPTYISSRGQSVIDYLITTPDGLWSINSMNIHQRVESDHLPISFSCRVELSKPEPRQKSRTTRTAIKYKWNNDHKEDYISKLRERLTMPSFLTNDDVDYDINNHVNYLQQTILDSAERMKITRRLSNSNSRKSTPTKNWYDEECYHVKKSVTSSLGSAIRATGRDCNTQEHRCLYLENRRIYKKLLRQKKRSHNKAEMRELLSLQKSDPRNWWRKIGWKAKPSDIQASARSLHQHFKNLLDNHADSTDKELKVNAMKRVDNWLSTEFVTDPILDGYITTDEINHSVNKLKTGKAAGPDHIISELIKHGYATLEAFLRDLLNRIYDTAKFPNEWQQQILHPIHKKGNKTDPKNYRGLSLISVFSKPLLNVLRNRIQAFCDNRQLLIKEQCGFRPGRSTLDNIFALNCRIQHALARNQTLYCMFIDYSKAFDTINRQLLWLKLLQMGFSSKLVRILMAIYSKVEFILNENVPFGDKSPSSDHDNNETRQPIRSNIGLKQGCPLSPILFSLFTNDIVEALRKDTSLEKSKDLSVLLYADDMVLFSESSRTLRCMIKNLEKYTDKWGLEVNMEKTQIVAFQKAPGPENKIKKKREAPPHFFKGTEIQSVEMYPYLGIKFHTSGKWTTQLNDAKTKGTRSLYKLKDKLDNFPYMPVEDILSLYRSCVQSGVFYGAEVWGTTNVEVIETIQNSFAKYVLGVRRQSPNTGALGELGLLPYKKYVQFLVIKFWIRIVVEKPPIIHDSYKLLMRVNSKRTWCNSVKGILDSLGFAEVWIAQGVPQKDLFLKIVLSRIRDIHVQEFDASCAQTPRLSVLRGLQENPCRTSLYLKCSPPIRKALAKLRLSSHYLEVEAGRWTKPVKTPREDRRCPFCEDAVEDEHHFILICPEYEHLRRIYIPMECRDTHPGQSQQRLSELLRSDSMVVLRKIGLFILYALKIRTPTMEKNSP